MRIPSFLPSFFFSSVVLFLFVTHDFLNKEVFDISNEQDTNMYLMSKKMNAKMLPVFDTKMDSYNENSYFIGKMLFIRINGEEKGTFLVSFNSDTNIKIVIKQLGKTLFEKELSISKDTTTDLGMIKVDDSNKLSEIIIDATKKLIEKKADRLIYNVQSSVFSNGVSGDELLKNIPRIDPTSDGFKIIGKSNVLIMVDDRLLNISGEELKNYLKKEIQI